MEKSKDNRFVIIVKIEKYIEYMLTILLKLPRTEVKTSMYEMMKNILLASKIDKSKRLSIYNIVDSNIYYQRICIRIMYMETIILLSIAITTILITTITTLVFVPRFNIKSDYIFYGIYTV